MHLHQAVVAPQNKRAAAIQKNMRAAKTPQNTRAAVILEKMRAAETMQNLRTVVKVVDHLHPHLILRSDRTTMTVALLS